MAALNPSLQLVPVAEPQLSLFPQLKTKQELVPVSRPAAQPEELGQVLSPTQARTYLDCSAKWWFRYGMRFPEPKTSSLALGISVHQALEANFREKLETGEDLPTMGIVMLFRDAWLEQITETQFQEDESPGELCRKGEEMVRKYMDEVAGGIQPAAVEQDVSGEIGGVRVRGRVDLVDTEGRIIDVKTAARKPSGISPSYAFQLATYRQITPNVSGEVRLDTLVKTKTVQLVQDSYAVSEEDLRLTHNLYPAVQEGIRSGLYVPNRQSFLCSRRNCVFSKRCEAEFGGSVPE